ncbi:MAG: hypothetical protein LBE84_00970, partial [Planctomycetota bacterium]|nr:hypothetical protein [Planctomycetota bacterium]
TANSFQKLRHLKNVVSARAVISVVFRTANGNEYNIIFAAAFFQPMPGGGLNVTAGPGQFGRLGYAKLILQAFVDLLPAGIPYFLFQFAHGAVFEQYRRVFRKNPPVILHGLILAK